MLVTQESNSERAKKGKVVAFTFVTEKWGGFSVCFDVVLTVLVADEQKIPPQAASMFDPLATSSIQTSTGKQMMVNVY